MAISARSIFVGMLFNLRGLENVFFYRKNDFPNLQPFPNFSHFREIWGKFLGFLQEANHWGCYLTYGITKNVFFYRKVFSKSYSHFPTFYNKSVGMLFNLRGLQEMFSFIKKLYSKIFSHFPILAIFGSLGLFFVTIARNKFVEMLFHLWGLQIMFLLQQIVFKNLLPIPNYSYYLGNLGLFYCDC